MFICPVCGYDLPFAPFDNEICPCCGVEFGTDDVSYTHEDLRRRWIHEGCNWFSDHTHPPPGWNPWSQVAKLLPPRAVSAASSLRNITKADRSHDIVRF